MLLGIAAMRTLILLLALAALSACDRGATPAGGSSGEGRAAQSAAGGSADEGKAARSAGR
jgi:hypothetical protein